MIYIKKINDIEYQLGGQVATDQMLDDGWTPYYGPIPEGQHFQLVEGILEPYDPPVPVLEQVRLYKEYLTNTDYKMLPGYVPKEGEDLKAVEEERNKAREYIRENEPKPL